MPYMPETMQKTTIYLDDIDREAIEIIKAAHGLMTASAAIRMTIRKEARLIAEGKQEKDKE